MNQFRKQVDVSPKHQAMTNKIVVEEPRDVYSDLKGLLSFAGAAADTATQFMNQKVEEDAMEQAYRTYQEKLPSEDATVGGYRAAATLGIKLESVKREARLAQLAATNPSEEDWKAALLNEAETSRQMLALKYPHLKDDPELQKVTAMDSIDAIPKLTSMREVARLKIEQQSRLEDFGEASILAARDPNVDFDAQIKNMALQLKLSPEQAKNALVDTAINSGDLNLIERVASMKVGDSKLTLADKDVRIAKALTNAKAQSARDNSAQVAADVVKVNEQLASGEMSPRQYIDYVDLKNQETGGAFMSQAQVESTLSSIAQQKGLENFTTQNANNVLTGAANLGNLANKDQQAIANSVLQIAISDEFKKLTEDQKGTIEGQTLARQRGVAVAAQKLHDSGVVSERLKQSIQSASGMDVDSVIMKGEDGREFINPEVQAMLNDYRSIPSHLRSMYVKGEHRKLIDGYSQFVDRGLEPAQALRQAQLGSVKVPMSGEAFLAADQVIEDVFRPWDGINLSESNEGYWQREIQQYQSEQFNPSGEEDQAAAVRHFKENTTRLSGNYIKGSPKYLLKSMGFDHQDEGTIQSAMYHHMEVNRASIERAIQVYGKFDYQDTIIDVNLDTGRVLLLTPNMMPIRASSASLADIGQGYRRSYNQKLRVNKEKGDLDAIRTAGPTSMSSWLYNK